MAPFMKTGAAATVFGAVAPPVPLRCFTRWRPEEIAAGVSDLEIADLVEQRRSASLFLVVDLHAKLYCTETTCLVTSANLTDSALGWRSPTNLEFAVLLPRVHPAIAALETSLRRLALPATPEIRSAVLAAADEATGPLASHRPTSQADKMFQNVNSLGSWIPTCLAPSRLYELYRGWDIDVSREAAEDGFRDLDILALPDGLSESAFNHSIRALLLQHPKLAPIIASAAVEPLSRETAEQYFGDFIEHNLESAAEAFRIAAFWVAYFFRERLEFRLEEQIETLAPPVKKQ